MHRSFAYGLPLLAGFLLAATGCGAAPELAGESVGNAEEAIQGGYVDSNDSSVVSIQDVYMGALCSGSLLAPNMVLTARHCVSPIINEVQGGVSCTQTTFGALRPAIHFLVETSTSVEQASTEHYVTQVIGVPTNGNLLCGNDQAILILSKNIDPSEAKPLTPRVDSSIAHGDQYYAIGFGETIANDNQTAGTRHRRDNLFIDCVADACPSYAAKPSEWIGETGICSGDSGGPALDMQERVIGVTSRGPSGCESPVYEYVYSWAQWIKDTAVYAAGLGGYTAPAWATGWSTDPGSAWGPLGAACTQPSDCSGSNRCLNDGTAQYCTRACNDQLPCDSGYTCDQGNLGVCVEDHTKSTKRKSSVTDDSGGCSVAGPQADPTKPVPWLTGAVLALALGLRRRRR